MFYALQEVHITCHIIRLNFKNPARGLEMDMEVLHSTPTETLGSHSLSFPILSPEEHGTADRDDAVPPEGNF